MSCNLSKYAYTKNGIIVFSNCIDHEEASANVFGEIPILNKGFIEITTIFDKNKQENVLDFELHCVVSEGHINETCENSQEIRNAINSLLFCRENHTEYVLTFSRFILFPVEFYHKDIADHLFYDFVVKGAGNMVIEMHQGKPQVVCYGESSALKTQANAVDQEILMDGLNLR